MKFQKKGFSLAEMLIVIVAVGIVAALTIPRLSRHFAKEQAASTLAKTVNQIESGFADALQVANNSSPASVYESIDIIRKRDLHIANSNDRATMRDLADHSLINMTPLGNGSYKVAKGSSTVRFEDTDIDNIHNNLPDSEADNNNYVDSMILIDINGDKGPNRDGEDRFVFFIQSNGKLKPYGRNPDATCADNNITDGLSCTARIVNEGYKISY